MYGGALNYLIIVRAERLIVQKARIRLLKDEKPIDSPVDAADRTRLSVQASW
jgi:hypothetical protein